MPTCYSNGLDDGGFPCGGGTVIVNSPIIPYQNSLFKDDSALPSGANATPSCFGGGGGCGCKETTPTINGGPANPNSNVPAPGNPLNPLFRARRYGMSSYQAAPETPDFLFAPEAKKFNRGKSGFFGLRIAREVPGAAFASPALPLPKPAGNRGE